MLRCKEARYFWFSVCWHLQDTTEGRFCLPPFCPYYVYAILGESGRIVCPRYALYVSRQYLRLEGAKPCPPGGPFLVGSRLAAWALPPARLRRSGGHPAACPVLAPTAGAPRGASAVCSRVSAPPGGPPGAGGPPSGLRPAARPVGPVRASPAGVRARLRWPRPIGAGARPSLGSALPPGCPGGRGAGSPSARSARPCGAGRASLRSGLALVLSPRLAGRVPPRGPPPPAAASPSLLPRGGPGLPPRSPPPRAAPPLPLLELAI